MNKQYIQQQFMLIIEEYIQMVRAELRARWGKWPINSDSIESHEVIGALLARQVSLATQLANSPSIWNGHIAPLILRTMVDTYITLAWIFDDPKERSKKFIIHGLGQLKLEIEHRKAQLKTEGKNESDDPVIKMKESILNSQRFSFLTEVNVGSWSGIDTRAMAEQANCLDLYRYAYTPFSAATHSMWHYISRYNLEKCANPLHRYHGVPVDPPMPVDIDYPYKAAKYVNKSFNLFDKKLSIKQDIPSAFDYLYEAIGKLGNKLDKIPKESNIIKRIVNRVKSIIIYVLKRLKNSSSVTK